MGRSSHLHPLSPAQQTLAAEPRHLALARGLAARAARRFPPLAEEFESAALAALVEAAAAFDPGRGLRFVTFATYRIRGAIEDARRMARPAGYRRAEWAPTVDSLATPLNREGVTTLADTIDDRCGPVGWELEYQDFVEGLARRTTSAVAATFRRLYGRADCLRMAAAGRAMGCSESWISLAHKQAVGQLRAHLEDPRL